MDTLYYSPGACSLAVHIVLEEIGEPFEAVRTAIAEGAHQRAEYLAINPRARVPALVTGRSTLTEASAILLHLADRHPSASLVPAHGDRMRVYEWLSFLASWVHVAYAQLWRGGRFTDDASAHPKIAEKGRANLADLYADIEGRVEGRPYALGDHFSIVDPYLFVFYCWAREVELRLDGYPSFAALAMRVLERPATTRALAREGLTIAGSRSVAPRER